MITSKMYFSYPKHWKCGMYICLEVALDLLQFDDGAGAGQPRTYLLVVLSESPQHQEHKRVVWGQRFIGQPPKTDWQWGLFEVEHPDKKLSPVPRNAFKRPIDVAVTTQSKQTEKSNWGEDQNTLWFVRKNVRLLHRQRVIDGAVHIEQLFMIRWCWSRQIIFGKNLQW